MKLAVLSTVALLATTGAASAYGVPEIERVQGHQRQRIEEGRDRGQLTRHEYRALQAEQRQISRMLWRARSDGGVSRREYHRIRAAQETASAHIRREKHDGQVNYWRKWRARYGS